MGGGGEATVVVTGGKESLAQKCRIHHSVVGLRSLISEGAVIEDALLMGADYYEVTPHQ